MLGTILSAGAGFWFAVTDDTSETVFVHHSQVANNRFLRANDRIEFEIADNPRKPGQKQALAVRYIGHVVGGAR